MPLQTTSGWIFSYLIRSVFNNSATVLYDVWSYLSQTSKTFLLGKLQQLIYKKKSMQCTKRQIVSGDERQTLYCGWILSFWHQRLFCDKMYSNPDCKTLSGLWQMSSLENRRSPATKESINLLIIILYWIITTAAPHYPQIHDATVSVIATWLAVNCGNCSILFQF